MERQVFDEAIGASPPSTVDVEAIIARERRAGRFRWATNPGVAAGGAVLAVVVGVAAAVLPGQPGDSGAVGAAGPRSSQTAPPSATPSPCDRMTRIRPPTAEVADAEAARLTGVLAALVHTQAPALLLADRTGVQHAPRGPLSFWHVLGIPGQAMPTIPDVQVSLEPASPNTVAPDGVCVGVGDLFVAYANASDTKGTGSLSVTVGPHGGSTDVSATCRMLRLLCITTTGPNGEEIGTAVRDEPKGMSYFVFVTKPDGTVVSIYADNVLDSLKSTNNASRPAPPLDLNQLVAIAVDPGMTLYPH